jgi:hypothetical protein
MDKSLPPMVEAWLEASKDLSIEVVHPFDLELHGRTCHYVALIKNFGAPKGTLILPLYYDFEDSELDTPDGYYASLLNPSSYGHYNRQKFIETLNDWGYFGEKSACPPWYTGKPWAPA